jgi:hypothetical protein
MIAQRDRSPALSLVCRDENRHATWSCPRIADPAFKKISSDFGHLEDRVNVKSTALMAREEHA